MKVTDGGENWNTKTCQLYRIKFLEILYFKSKKEGNIGMFYRKLL